MNFRKGFLGSFIGFGIIALVADHLCLLYSESASLPYHYFLKLKKVTPQKGDYTCIESPWYGHKVIKEIAGKSGDKIMYDADGALWIGSRRIGVLQGKALDGRALTPISAGKILEGFVFLAGPHERSFDSRYQELGLVPEKALQGRVLGLI